MSRDRTIHWQKTQNANICGLFNGNQADVNTHIPSKVLYTFI